MSRTLSTLTGPPLSGPLVFGRISFATVAHLAAQPITFDATLARRLARLVLIDNADLKLQKACYREGHYLLAPADPVLVGRNTLQQWLWDRLAMPSDQEVH